MAQKEINKPLLILNFDINKTIILGDKSKKLDVENGLRIAIGDYSWGIYDEKTRNWSLTENYFSLQQPKPNLISYENYMKKKYKKKTEEEIPDRDDRAEKNEELKKIRESQILKFLDQGQPGEKLHKKYLEILEKVKVPQKIMDEINKENSKYPSFYKELYLNGYIFIFYSLFRLMIELQNKNRIYTLIFRTFGTDFDDAIKEFNSFCEGEHPIFSGENEKYPKIYFNGTHNSKDYRIKESHIGIIHRFDENIDNCYKVLGTIKKMKFEKPEDLYSFYKEKIDKGEINIIKGGKGIYEYIQNNSINGKINSFCINDHYDTWLNMKINLYVGSQCLLIQKIKMLKFFSLMII